MGRQRERTGQSPHKTVEQIADELIMGQVREVAPGTYGQLVPIMRAGNRFQRTAASHLLTKAVMRLRLFGHIPSAKETMDAARGIARKKQDLT